MTTQTVRDPATGRNPTGTGEVAKHWIDGEWVGSETVSESINPATGETVKTYPTITDAELPPFATLTPM